MAKKSKEAPERSFRCRNCGREFHGHLAADSLTVSVDKCPNCPQVYITQVDVLDGFTGTPFDFGGHAPKQEGWPAHERGSS